MKYIVPNLNPRGCVGHQFSNWLSARMLSVKYNLRFVHVPFHGRSKPYKTFLGLGRGHLRQKDIPKGKRKPKLVQLPRVVKDNASVSHPRFVKTLGRQGNILFRCARDQFIRTDWDNFGSIGDELKQSYWAQRSLNPVETSYDGSRLNVAIHVRRGDVTPALAKRWTPDGFYVKLISNLRRVLPTETDYHLFSHGNRSRFASFEKIPDLHFHINEDEFISLHHLVCADVLVTSKSNFSFIASVLSSGFKLSIPFSVFWSDIPDYLPATEISSKAEFDPAKLMAYVSQKLEA